MGCTQSSGSKMANANQTVAEFLKDDIFFAHLSDSGLVRAAKLFEVVSVNTGDRNKRTVLLKKGQISDALYVVAEGQVLFFAHRDGRDRVLRELRMHDKFGEFGVINGASSRVDVSLVGDGTVLKLPKATIEKETKNKSLAHLRSWLQSTESAMMAQKLKDVDFLSKVPKDLLSLVARLFTSRIVPKGETLCEEGNTNDKFFIVAKGSFVLTIKDETSLFLELSRLRVGDTFGELSLLEDQPATATVTALSESMVFALTRSSFQEFSDLVPDIYLDMKRNILERNAVALVSNRIPFAKSLTPSKLHLLGTVARMNKYPPGHLIFREGSKDPLTFYVIARGSVDVIVGGSKVRTMKMGDYFGEVSLVSDAPHTASVVVSRKEPLYCLEISQRDFNALFQSERTVLAEIQIKVLGERAELRHVLNHPIGQQFFIKQLEREFAVENIEFWTAVDRMESMGKQRFDPRVIEALGLDMPTFRQHIQRILRETSAEIFEKHLAPNANTPINIQSQTMDDIRQAVSRGKLSYDMFDEAKAEIYDLMERDNFARFRSSPLFKELLRKVGTYDDNEISKMKTDITGRGRSVMHK